MSDTINVAGVTFVNPDGEERQKILQNFGFGYRYAILQETTFEGERAVEVWVDSKLIGYIPRKELNNPLSRMNLLVAQICYYEEKDIYCATLSPVEEPSTAACYVMQAYCEKNHISPPTVIDTRAFNLFWHQECLTASQLAL